MLPYPLVIAALLLVIAPALPASDYERRAEELEALREEIETIERSLQQRRQQADRVGTELADVERRMSDATRRLRELGEERERNLRRLEALEAQAVEQDQAVENHRDYLREEIRSAYALGRQQLLKLLLNQENPASLDRNLAYFDYLSRARRERIQQALSELEQLAELRRAVDGERQQLEALEREQRDRGEQLAEARRERASVLSRLTAEIDSDGERLRRLNEDEAELESMLDRLREALADIPERELDRQPFASQRGSLRWPVDGRIRVAFGSREGRMDGHWQGILLAASDGQAITAVAHGRVVFADWLRGYGLLLIIDHGDGHMTLYGYNDSLYKEVGDWVEPGETIAAAGSSGGREQPGLYFELRVQGRPQDPITWLRRRG
ncbi:MAG: peptidoglycan DD-metalloendopeptidase family protein [Ectothiorhodospiraceae bacterium]|nr:peptidoglycan DD-metalloendopeptidase family protein [Ectothiorhodospiraceae bacterium]